MYEENLSKLLSFETKIKSDGSVDLPAEKLKKLFDNGYCEIKIDIYGETIKAVENSGLDINLFNQIKFIQKLPDNVVLNFMKSKGSLVNSNIQARINEK